MRSHRQSQYRNHTRVWIQYINGYPDGPVFESTAPDTYTNDLVDSRSSFHFDEETGNSHNYGSGGDFEVVKRTHYESSSLPPGDVKLYGSNGGPGKPSTRAIFSKQRAGGSPVVNAMFPNPASSTKSQLEALGRQAISRTLPTTSEVDLSSTLAEIISEGLPSMIGLATYRGGTKAARSAAEENLNYEFGVRPLISDVQKAVDVHRRSKQIWDQYVANAGKVLRRRYDFRPELKVTRYNTRGNPAPYGDRFLYTGDDHPLEIVTTEIKRQWFVGHYTYAIPRDPFERNLSQWNKLYGVVPDVETLWNLAPWTWALDWIGDFGTTVSNFSALQADGLVLKSGYMMEYTSKEQVYYLGPVRYSPHESNPKPAYFTQSFKTERKRRVVASPYGFQLDWDGFSPRQIGILASLGITRGSRR